MSDSPVGGVPDGRASHGRAPDPGASASGRLGAGLVFAVTLGVLLVASTLEPASAGYGTHQDLGLPECGFKSWTAFPCATCGMTTAFSHAASGNLIAAFRVQPTGTLLALMTAMAAVVSGASLTFGFSLAPLGLWLQRPAVLFTLGAALLLGWLYTLSTTIG